MPEITEDQMKEFESFKANNESLAAEKAKLEKDLEDTRMEVLTPEYTAFLDAQEAAKNKPKEKEKKADDNDDEFSKLSPKQLFERAKQAAIDEIDSRAKARDAETAKEREIRSKREIAAFAKEHADYEQFRPLMYGLSLDPKNTDLNIEQLYDKAKKHAKTLGSGATDEQKEKGRRMNNERPGHDSGSLEKLKKMSDNDIAREALDAIKTELGPIPLG